MKGENKNEENRKEKCALKSDLSQHNTFILRICSVESPIKLGTE